MEVHMDKVLIGEILGPETNDEKAAERERRVRSGFWQTAAKAARRIPFMEDVAAAYYCALDPATPTRTRAILLAALAYFVLPTDFVPDFIAGFGFTDDIAVLSAALAAVRGAMRESHYAAARRALADSATRSDKA
jgi:uncharacterized membrane protein YkvA (DUF1232 family)